MSRLTLRLLGGFEVRADAGELLAVPTRKAQALLAYLALMAGQTHLRDKLAFLLWADAPPAAARNALRQTMFVLRKALAPIKPATLVMAGDGIRLPSHIVETDVAAFERLVRDGTLAALEEAVALYQGDLLAGLGPASASFEDWLMSERERLRELALEANARLLAHYRTTGATTAAMQSALRLLAIDPLQEAVHRTLMRLFTQVGRRDAALRQYQKCAEVLQRELGIEPEAETRELYGQILNRAVQPEGGATGRGSEAPQQTARAYSQAAIRLQETVLVGRDRELAHV